MRVEAKSFFVMEFVNFEGEEEREGKKGEEKQREELE